MALSMTGVPMSDNPFLRVSNLREFLGQERFDALLDLDGRDEIRDFCDKLIEDKQNFPDHVILGGKKYRLFSPFREYEEKIQGFEFERRLEDREGVRAFGQDDFSFVKDKCDDIPEIFQGKITFIFLQARSPHIFSNVYSLSFKNGYWYDKYKSLATHFDRTCRVLFEVKE